MGLSNFAGGGFVEEDVVKMVLDNDLSSPWHHVSVSSCTPPLQPTTPQHTSLQLGSARCSTTHHRFSSLQLGQHRCSTQHHSLTFHKLRPAPLQHTTPQTHLTLVWSTTTAAHHTTFSPHSSLVQHHCCSTPHHSFTSLYLGTAPLQHTLPQSRLILAWSSTTAAHHTTVSTHSSLVQDRCSIPHQSLAYP